MKFKYFLYCCLIFFSGCKMTFPGLYSGYKKLSPTDRERIIFVTPNDDICTLNKDEKFYSITADHLLSCLVRKDSSIIYFWAASCHSAACIPLRAAFDYCNENNYSLFIVSEYYALEQAKIQNKTNLPVFHINQIYYKTDFCNKYDRLFSEDLARVKRFKKEDKYSRFFVFHKDKLVRTKQMLIL